MLEARNVAVREELDKHRVKSASKAHSKREVENPLGKDEIEWRAIPLWRNHGNVAPGEGGIVHIVEDDTKEIGGFFASVLLQQGLKVNNKGGNQGGQ